MTFLNLNSFVQVLQVQINLADMPAYVLEGEYKDPEFGKQMILEKGMIKDNINYYIRYFASPSQYQNYLDEVESMIQSFKIQK